MKYDEELKISIVMKLPLFQIPFKDMQITVIVANLNKETEKDLITYIKNKMKQEHVTILSEMILSDYIKEWHKNGTTSR